MLLQGKKAFVFGVLNEYSIGYAVAEQLHANGCQMAFSHLPGEKIERRVTLGSTILRQLIVARPGKELELIKTQRAKAKELAAAAAAAAAVAAAAAAMSPAVEY